jgi:hypothetical protein
VHSDVGQHFAVELDLGFLQAVGELAVSQAALTGCSVDTRNPQLAEDTFFGTAVTICILTGLHHRFFSDAEDITAATAETFGKGENFFVAGASRYTTFDARHVLLLVRLN